jgi:hypothetical protein
MAEVAGALRALPGIRHVSVSDDGGDGSALVTADVGVAAPATRADELVALVWADLR